MQTSLFPGQCRSFHGGRLAKGRRKTRRPLARNRPIHLVLKSRRKDLLAHRHQVEAVLLGLAQRFCLRTYEIAVNHDHIHMTMRFPGRLEYNSFIRAVTGILARKLGKGLWLLTPFTRVLQWGKDFRRTNDYVIQNRAEAAGARPYAPRKNYYSRYQSG